MFKALMTAVYPVAEHRLNDAKAWYSDLLAQAPYFDQPFYVGFNVAGFELGLHPVAETEAGIQRHGVCAYWGVDDVAATLAHAVALGAEQIEAAQDVGDGIIVARLRDPFGNYFGLIDNPHFSLKGQ